MTINLLNLNNPNFIFRMHLDILKLLYLAILLIDNFITIHDYVAKRL